MDIDGEYEKLESLKVKDEVKGKELSIEQKKALIREAKKKFGPNWRKVLGIVGSLRVNSEALHTMYGNGLGELRDMNNPKKFRG